MTPSLHPMRRSDDDATTPDPVGATTDVGGPFVRVPAECAPVARDAAMAAAALGMAGFDADFTPESIAHVEVFLTRCAPSRPDPVEVAFLVRMLGTYVGEVIARAHGGVWEAEPPAREVSCIVFEDGTRFSPFVWLERRLAQPRGEPLEHKYQRFFVESLPR